MFSGFQEILLLALIGLGIFLIPRMMPNSRKTVKTERPVGILTALSGKMRLALVISVIWPLIVAFYIAPWADDLNLFLIIGPGVVITGWGTAWVISGFKQR